MKAWFQLLSARSGLLACLVAVQSSLVAAAESDVRASATGFIVNADGWIVTNAHVLEGCNSATVISLPGNVGSWVIDEINDLAALRLDSAVGRSNLPLRRVPPRLGEDVAALGFPLSTLLSDSVKITTGNVNSLVGIRNDTRFIQISTPIQPGNSGGPVVDKRGSVLGVATATLGLAVAVDAGALPQNVNFAVKSNVLEIFLQSRGIKFTSTDTGGVDLSTADLADRVAPAVVQVLCHGAAPSPAEATATAPAQPAPTPPDAPPSASGQSPEPGVSNEQIAIGFAAQCQAAWSQPNDVALAFMLGAYADHVSFYGKTVALADVMQEKRKFAARWPLRGYSMRPGTVSANCNGSFCRVTSLIDWFAKSEARMKSASGVASFELTIDTSRSKIVGETGTVIKGQKPEIEPVLDRWHELNGLCRGGAGDSQKTMEACEARNRVDSILAAADWCYGREGEFGSQMEWHTCGH